jgi:metallo-beta-lactamase class B
MIWSGTKLGTGLIGVMLFGAAAHAQASAPADTPDTKVMHEHLVKATKIAGSDLTMDMYHRCFIEPLYPDSIAKLINGTAAVAPAQVFDNLYFVGQNAVSSWVIRTSAGLIVIDTENNPDEARQYVEGGITKLGLDPKQIKYIILTHEHADHFGGSKYLKEQYGKYGAHIITSAAAWKNLADPKTRNQYLAPAHDQDVTDGQKLTLGDTTLTFYVTPGHTEGTVSFFFKTTDHGVPHVVGFFGGMGSPKIEANRDTIIKSYERWVKLAAAAGADTLIANHQGEDHAVEKIEYLRSRDPGDPNPFVVGKDAYRRYFEIQDECTKVDLARHGEKVPQ